MDIIIQSTLKTLRKTEYLLVNLSNEQLSDESVAPYYSSIGSHLRHILDFYDCILKIDYNKQIDLTVRNRSRETEKCCELAKKYLNSIIDKIKNATYNLDDMVTVTDDLGLGKIEMSYTMAAILSQANNHTIHHYAIINYIMNGLNISMVTPDFGYNPTTPKLTEWY